MLRRLLRQQGHRTSPRLRRELEQWCWQPSLHMAATQRRSRPNRVPPPQAAMSRFQRMGPGPVPQRCPAIKDRSDQPRRECLFVLQPAVSCLVPASDSGKHPKVGAIPHHHGEPSDKPLRPVFIVLLRFSEERLPCGLRHPLAHTESGALASLTSEDQSCLQALTDVVSHAVITAASCCRRNLSADGSGETGDGVG